MATKELNIIDLLCAMDIPSAPTTEVKIKRLSVTTGQDVVFKIKAISYNRMSEITKFTEDYDLNVVREGVTEPNLADEKLKNKFGVITPNELIMKLLLPGEISKIAREIEKLSGFEKFSIEEIKKK